MEDPCVFTDSLQNMLEVELHGNLCPTQMIVPYGVQQALAIRTTMITMQETLVLGEWAETPLC